MTGLELPVALVLLLNLAVSLQRVMRGPGDADRLLATLLFGTTGIGIIVLLAFADGGPARTGFIDVALTLALLATLSGIAFARRAWRRAHDDEAEPANDEIEAR
ncbi:MAG: monovalent cation/H+ antiporter complex subunit F [Azonexus sp.]